MPLLAWVQSFLLIKEEQRKLSPEIIIINNFKILRYFFPKNVKKLSTTFQCKANTFSENIVETSRDNSREGKKISFASS